MMQNKETNNNDIVLILGCVDKNLSEVECNDSVGHNNLIAKLAC
jgi:hypothetical protein